MKSERRRRRRPVKRWVGEERRYCRVGTGVAKGRQLLRKLGGEGEGEER